MKRLVLLVVVALGMSATSFAGEKVEGNRMHGGKRMDQTLLFLHAVLVLRRRIDVGIIVKERNGKILRQIFQHVTAARRTAAVQQQGRNFTVKSCNLRIQLLLVISFIGHNVSSNLLVSFNPFYYSLSAAGMQAAYDIL